MSMRVWGLMFPLLCLTACASERLVPVTKVVEVPGPVRWQAIPKALLKPCEPLPIPERATYADLIEIHAGDRSVIDTCEGQLEAIRSLGDPDGIPE